MRFCLDYRKLNNVTVFDAEPIPDVEEIFTRLSDKLFLTKIDLSKGSTGIGGVLMQDRDEELHPRYRNDAGDPVS
nr:hypothetical protein BaRGS_011118 [Batillaria attramentaria]